MDGKVIEDTFVEVWKAINRQREEREALAVRVSALERRPQPIENDRAAEMLNSKPLP